MDNNNFFKRLKSLIFGSPVDTKNPKLFHKLSLIPLLAWIGLGADGLSSSAYGPEEAYRTLGSHTYLAIFIALSMIITILVISYSYSKIIEHFPHGGGGYIVASHTLGEKAGLVSGSALIIDYVLTITVSISSCGDAIFSFLPMHYHQYKFAFKFLLIIFLIVLNIRGVKESVTILTPIFVLFLLTHIFLIAYGIGHNSSKTSYVIYEAHEGLKNDIPSLGLWGIIFLFLHAYSMGGGTYTGLEAVSNGLQIMRDPKVETGKKTMVYMALSLAFVASGIFFCYLLYDVKPQEGMTLNAVLASKIFSSFSYNSSLALVTILSEGLLLLVGAQTGFIDGPRVIANMAVDSWFPHKFASLSERLTMKNGILTMGTAALIILIYTNGNIGTLVVMYSINVFLTFSLSQLGMIRFFIKHKNNVSSWKKSLIVHLTGFLLCATILGVTIIVKFAEGGWVTIFLTSLLIILCLLIKSHYNMVKKHITNLNEIFKDIATGVKVKERVIVDYEATAIILVSGYNGFGIHTFLSIIRNFPNTFSKFFFVSVAVIDSGTFKGASELKNLETHTKNYLEQYIDLAKRFGCDANYLYTTGTDVVEKASELCEQVNIQYARTTVFTGQLIFKYEKFFHKFLHNEISFAIQRRLLWNGITTVILPIRINE